MLEIRNLTKAFGGLTAVNNVTTTVEYGKVNAIIGPNGAGKSTFFNLISGAILSTSGQITLRGRDITRLGAARIATLGLARTFQTTALFDAATVVDNLIVGHRLRTRSGLLDVLLNSARLVREEKLCREKALEALDFVGLAHIRDRLAADITQEQRRRVAFALAYATQPSLALLDEPAGGLNPEETTRIAELIRKFVTHGITVCLIEHKMSMIMNIADKIMVLNHGERIAEGTPQEIRSNPAVIDAYLGSDHVEA
ncbi:ABC transporter ATP-binding protein [Variovorax sp. 770b2]|uniref:ABC transporter ATP-binding protein n=1 Tax=Variovorax sp. 770b2 TaxID=1566271 RepID=UPI0008F0D2B3|nr:ABC transporter ATP-binding protein [Variovorax sp. 770b2]SFQ05401.1 amino acid/amide ABC transporter ATP-binding protein 1, HAAT family (TC 3.A.1.4.-) [Variovorax sp. 770b2]